MKKKLVTGALLLAFGAVAVTGGTLAYFTDTDKEENVFTVGNVQIDLIESQYHRVNAGKGYTTEAEPIIGGYLWASGVDLQGNLENTPSRADAAWSGAFFSDEQILNDAKTYKNENGYFETNATNMVPGDNVRKNPYVVNTGSNDAYVRINAYIPVKLFTVLDQGPSYWVSTALTSGDMYSAAVDKYNANGYKAEGAVEVVKYNEEDCYKFDFRYEDKLAPGAVTFWSAWGNIAIDRYATEAELADIKSFNVYFDAEAIQAEGFASAADAFAAYDAQVAANQPQA